MRILKVGICNTYTKMGKMVELHVATSEGTYLMTFSADDFSNGWLRIREDGRKAGAAGAVAALQEARGGPLPPWAMEAFEGWLIDLQAVRNAGRALAASADGGRRLLRTSGKRVKWLGRRTRGWRA